MKRLLTVLAALLPLLAFADSQEARLLRFPAVGGDNIVFTYAGDLYRVGINGGKAERLTSHVGYEMFARISPDGNLPPAPSGSTSFATRSKFSP